MDNFGSYETMLIEQSDYDLKMIEKLFKNPATADPLKQMAGAKDGTLAALIGIAARKSIETSKPIKIVDLMNAELKEEKKVTPKKAPAKKAPTKTTKKTTSKSTKRN